MTFTPVLLEQVQFYARDPLKKAFSKIYNILTNSETFGVMKLKTHSAYEMFVVATVLSNIGEVEQGGQNLHDLINSSMKYIRTLVELKAIPFPIALQCHRSLNRINEIAESMSEIYSKHENFQGNYLGESQKVYSSAYAISRVILLVDECIAYCLSNLETAFDSLKKLEAANAKMEEIGYSHGFLTQPSSPKSECTEE